MRTARIDPCVPFSPHTNTTPSHAPLDPAERQPENEHDEPILGKCDTAKLKRKRITWATPLHEGINPSDGPMIRTKCGKRNPGNHHTSVATRPIDSKRLKTETPVSPDHHVTQPHVITTNATKPAWPDDLIGKVTATANLPSPLLAQPPFSFELTLEAAHKNFCILRRYGGSLEAIIQNNRNSPIAYGSEFRPPHELEPILRLHPNWPAFHRLLTQGSDWPLSEIRDDERIADMTEALSFGNHKGATKNYPILRKLIEDDVTHGYSLPLPLKKIHLLPGVLLAPMNIVEQDTIDAQGNTTPKFRLTHDQSFKFKGSNSSLNSRLHKDKLHPCYFGWVIRRLINWTVAARRKFPNRRIFATKVDFKSAYRRLHLNSRISVQSCTQLPEDEIALMALRLTFGGAACPFEWSIISETICDLATAIAHDEKWNPNTLYAPDQELVPPPTFLPDDVPFAPGEELIVDVEVDERGIHEMYLDDIVGIGIDLPETDNRERAARAPLLAIHTCARPPLRKEPTPRETMAAKNKLTAEAGLSEEKIILGWKWDFRRLIISLPPNKHEAWSNAIQLMTSTRETLTSTLESTIGRLGHLALVIPFVHHFMSRLRELHTCAARKKRRKTHITPTCLEDLNLMLFFLTKARGGVNMNQIAFRRPTHVYRSDSCPAGLGGYSHAGFAWRIYLPEHLLFRASNNLLEHIAAIITPWVDIIAGRLNKGNCALSMTDSTTSEGWLRKTNFKEDDDPIQAGVRIQVAREHAMRYMNHEIRDYSTVELRNCTSPQRNRLLADLDAAADARTRAVQGGTHKDHARSWDRWTQYCESTGLEHDPYLTSLSRQQKIQFVGAFAAAIRDARFTRNPSATLALSSVKSAIGHVVASFRSQGHPNPTRDTDGLLAWPLSRQYRAYKNDDPKEIQQKAIPLCVLSAIALKDETETQRATTQLIIGAFFFACRSCEYLRVPNAKEKKTKCLTLQNITFHLNGAILPHSSPLLPAADNVAITFETQKNGRKFDTVTQWATRHDTLCPVTQWASLVKRIRTYPGANDNTNVSAVWHHGRIHHITSKEITNALRDGVTFFGSEKLRIAPQEIGTHSIRSGAAMAMYLGGVPVFAIQIIGRWSSDAFMKYIRKQVEEFTFDVSARMLTMQTFMHCHNQATHRREENESGGTAARMLGRTKVEIASDSGPRERFDSRVKSLSPTWLLGPPFPANWDSSQLQQTRVSSRLGTG